MSATKSSNNERPSYSLSHLAVINSLHNARSSGSKLPSSFELVDFILETTAAAPDAGRAGRK
jgi:hypothetical protein